MTQASPAAASAAWARNSSTGSSVHPGWWKIASSSTQGRARRAAKARASVDFPDPEFPTTLTRRTVGMVP